MGGKIAALPSANFPPSLPPGRGTPVIFPLRQTSGRGASFVPRRWCSVSRARRRSRTPAGRTKRRSRRGHHPAGTAGKVRADAPHDRRRTGDSPTQETNFAFPHKGEYGGAGGVEGIFPSHPMPRAGQATRRPRRAEAAIHRGTPAQYDQDVLPFSTLNCSIEHFQFEMLCISNHTVCRFAKKRFSRSLGPAALASRSAVFKGKTHKKRALLAGERVLQILFSPPAGPF